MDTQQAQEFFGVAGLTMVAVIALALSHKRRPSPPPPPALTVSLATSASGATAGAQIGFTASPSGGTTPYRFVFTFGDGQTASTSSPQAAHAYATAGQYSASVQVFDALGHSAVSGLRSILISAPPPPPTGFPMPASSGVISPPFYVAGGAVLQNTETLDPLTGGKAVYSFYIPTAGAYVVDVMVNAVSSSSDSLFVNIDSEPVAPDHIWDIGITAGFEWRRVEWRSINGVPVFQLGAGQHALIIRGREAGVAFSQVDLEVTTAPPPPPPPPPSLGLFHPSSIWRKPIGVSPTYLTQYDAFYQASTPAQFTLSMQNPVYAFDARSTPRSITDGLPVGNPPEPPTLLLPVPLNAWPSSESDGNLILLDRANGLAFSYYRWSPDGDGTYTYEGAWYGDIGPMGSGILSAWGNTGPINYRRWNGNRAPKWSYLPGLVLLSEIASGVVDHALLVSIDLTLIQATPNYVWPAYESDGASSNSGHPKMGMRVQLDPTLDLNSLGLTPAAKILAKALQTYGAYIGDSGSAGWGHHMLHLEGFYSAPGIHDNSSWAAIGIDENSLKAIPMPSLRIVQALQGDFYATTTFPALPPHS